MSYAVFCFTMVVRPVSSVAAALIYMALGYVPSMRQRISIVPPFEPANYTWLVWMESLLATVLSFAIVSHFVGRLMFHELRPSTAAINRFSLRSEHCPRNAPTKSEK